MKLFSLVPAFSLGEYVSFKEVSHAYYNGEPLTNWWIGNDKDRTHMHDSWKVCGKPKNPNNAIVDCNGSRCASICTPGYFTKGRFDGSICRKGKWSIPQPACETCAMPEIQSRPGLDSMCAVNARNGRMTCKIQCTNGGKIFGKISRPIACKCHNKNGCHWMFTGKGMRREDKHKVDLDALERICPRPEKPNPPPVVDTCPKAEKVPKCTNVTKHAQVMNSWTCRDCHRLRVYFNKRNYAPALNKFDNRDSLYVKLSVRAQFDKWAHPAEKPIYIGNNEYRIPFSALKDFTDGNVDFTAEFRPLGSVEPKIVSVRTCPCSFQQEPDYCDSDNDCDGVCHKEKCVECANNGDCFNGGICKKNICYGCEADSDCRNGQVCSDQQMCVDCTSDNQCGDGEVCTRGQCVQCSADKDCEGNANGGRCHDNRCVECRNHGHCDDYQRCTKSKYCE